MTSKPLMRWHVYGGLVADDMTTFDPDGDVYMTVIVGPTNLGPDDIVPAKQAPMRDVHPHLPHIAVFDHEPTLLEKDQLQPESHQEFYPDGTKRPEEV